MTKPQPPWLLRLHSLLLHSPPGPPTSRLHSPLERYYCSLALCSLKEIGRFVRDRTRIYFWTNNWAADVGPRIYHVS
ncbi:unnamed protein product, partial [Dovyalis caffra]